MSEYIPGVCNIGPAEISRRRTTGIVGSTVAAALLTALVAAGAPKPVRLLVALPASMGATGFIQAATRFCAGFGARGVFNFGDTGSTDTVEQQEFRNEDRRKALQILGASAAIGGGVAAAGLLLP